MCLPETNATFGAHCRAC